jgi:alkylation response protein AidB-like acyl-CoA dehydrogenase
MTENHRGGKFLTRPAMTDTVFTPEEFTREHKAIAKTVREFIAGELQSRGDEIEHVNNDLSRLLMQKAGEIGLLAADIPEEYDGMALDKISSLIISDMLGQGAGSFTITELNHTGIGTLPLAFFGTEKQKKKYLPGLSSGELIGAFGLTEPDAGSDALNAQTTAVLSEDGTHYIINGSKCFITNAGFADLIFTFAKVDGKAFTAFIVEFDSEGVSTDAEEVKMGMKGTSTRSVNFKKVRVPVENVLGEVGRGHVVALNALNMGRFKVGAVCTGNARSVLAEAVKYAKQRMQFNQPICEFGLIKEKIGDMASRFFAGESMMYRTAGMINGKIKASGDVPAADVGRVTAGALEEFLVECSIMKIYGSELQGFVADQAVQIFGGYGYIYENPAELAYRNGRINRIWEGTNEINRTTIAGTLLKRIAKGRLDLNLDPAAAAEALSALEPVTVDSADTLDAQKAMLAVGKAVTHYVITIANQRLNGDLSTHQEVAGIISDMVIAIFATESALLRAEKIMSAKKRTNADIAVRMAKLVTVRFYDQLRSLVSRILPAVMDADVWIEQRSQIDKLLSLPAIDTITMNREIADICIKKNGVSIKIA